MNDKFTITKGTDGAYLLFHHRESFGHGDKLISVGNQTISEAHKHIKPYVDEFDIGSYEVEIR